MARVSAREGIFTLGFSAVIVLTSARALAVDAVPLELTWNATVDEFGLRSALHLGSRLWLEAAAEVAIPTLREEFALGGVGIVHRPSPAIARASLGLGITL